MTEAKATPRRPDETGVPDPFPFMHPVLKKNYGQWAWHDRPRPGVLHHVATRLSNATILDPFDNTTNLLEGADTDTLKWYAERIESIRTGLISAAGMSDEQHAYDCVKARLEND